MKNMMNAVTKGQLKEIADITDTLQDREWPNVVRSELPTGQVQTSIEDP